ncbi:preprotein translocase subunit SecG [Mycoplasmopsis agassizii]|uniref:Protein-export membrane protein SecG n=1 Tax=Mycoplasmopsis agassizii TaxID=33922 RepID=A0A1W1X5L6_9BACT|nr:preprotein translocase subunit SecG [Mycoplasmopsis agassizii]PAF55228.1 preprotein translocase subunit SecG [Mycoplasmopsis agassizii]PAK21350.1 preprotein translocase subunit SecG [Mycoplasmopsis agassizii]SMC18761.1 preprotein translocase subunit SecG [Mycoplasmopsis agassizii]
MTAVLVILILLGLIIIVISLIMSPDSNGFSGALVGSGDLELFKFSKERGFKKFIKYAMIITGIIFIILGIVIRIFF